MVCYPSRFQICTGQASVKPAAFSRKDWKVKEPMSLRCLFHGHQIIRYDRESAWECIRCLKKWPMAKELVSPSGVFARKVFAAVKAPARPAVMTVRELGRPQVEGFAYPPRAA
jgi:hypothetical protein